MLVVRSHFITVFPSILFVSLLGPTAANDMGSMACMRQSLVRVGHRSLVSRWNIPLDGKLSSRGVTSDTPARSAVFLPNPKLGTTTIVSGGISHFVQMK